MSRYMLIQVFCQKVGYSDKAVRRKIESRQWMEGRHFIRAPDGHILIDLEGFYSWVGGKG